MATRYHAGELAVQARLGTLAQATGIARTVKSALPEVLTRFLATQRWIVLGGYGEDDCVWASITVGDAGFVHGVDPQTVRVAGHPPPGDPLRGLGSSATRAPVGMLAIDLDRRMRARINGTASCDADGLRIHVEQAYANCTKYIQRRELLDATTQRGRRAPDPDVGERLSDTQAGIVGRADTAFIATAAPGYGADASHRGGSPGFLECSPDGTRIRFADYPGNGVFNTLGNLELDGRAGLTIPVFESGDALSLTGRATVTRPPGENSAAVVELRIERVVHLFGVLPFQFGGVEYSKFLPPLRADDVHVGVHQ